MPLTPIELKETLDSGEFYLSLRLDPNEFGCNDYDDPEDFIHEHIDQTIKRTLGMRLRSLR